MPIYAQNYYVCDECSQRWPEAGWSNNEPPGWIEAEIDQDGDPATIYCRPCWNKLVAEEGEDPGA